MAAASGCSLTRSRLATSRRSCDSSRPDCATTVVSAGLPSVKRAGLVHDHRVDLLHHLERLGVAEQHAEFRAPPGADHDRHRRRQAERARAGDDQHGDGVHERVGQARLGPPDGPDGEGDGRSQDHGRHEPARDGVGQALNGRARALRLAHQPDDLRQQGVAADALGLHHEGAGAVHRAARDLAGGGLLDRNRLASDHRFVDGALALDDDAVDRHPLARPHAQTVADLHLLERHLLLVPGVVEATGRGGRQAEQLPDGRTRAAPRAQFEHLAEQHEHDDDRRRLEVDADLIAVRAERRRKQARRQRRDHAEPVGRADAERDQREHVQVPVHDRRPAPHEERPSAPQHDRSGQQELRPGHRRRVAARAGAAGRAGTPRP